MKVKAQDKDFHTAQQSPLKFTKEKLCDYTLFCCYWMNEGRVIYEKAKTMKNISYKKNEWPEYKLFSSMLFQNTPPPKCPPSTPLSPVPLLTRWNLQQKFSFFLAILGLEKKSWSQGAILQKNKTLIMKIASENFHCMWAFMFAQISKRKKKFSTFKLILALAKKN